MRIEHQGIILYPTELKALLRFAAKEAENPMSNIHFRIEGDSLFAYASNNQRAVQAIGEVAQGAPDAGEWTVFRDFLAACLRLVETGQYVVIEVAGATVNRAVTRNSETHEEAAELGWPTDAAHLQMTFPHETLRKIIQLPTTERPVRCLTINSEYLGDLKIVGEAAGTAALDLFVGKSRHDPLVFQFQEEGLDTEWRGLIATIRARAGEEDALTSPLGDVEVEYIDPATGEVTKSSVIDITKRLEEQKRKGRKQKRDEEKERKNPGLPFDGDGPEDDE